MAKHTGGEWKAIRDEVVHHPSGYALAEASGIRWVPANDDWESDDLETAIANARVMAAAPQLLEALKACLVFSEHGESLAVPTLERYQALIAKAEGH